MKQSIVTLHNRTMNCMYDADRFTESEVMDLLSEGALKLFSQKKQIYETENAVSYRLKINGHVYFGKEFKISRWYRKIWNHFFPACQNNFKAGIKILEAGLPTPQPLIAASLRENSSRKQILLTAFCDNAIGLDCFAVHYNQAERLAIMEKVADLLAVFFTKGFYSKHLRSANILISKIEGFYQFWFIDLDLLVSSRLRPRTAFINMVSRASYEFFEHLSPNERLYWLKCCFESACRYKILQHSGNEDIFSSKVVDQIKKRHPSIILDYKYNGKKNDGY